MYIQMFCCRWLMVFMVCTLLFLFSIPPVDAQTGATLFLPLVQAVKIPIRSTVVTTQADELNQDGDCSLREAIQATNTGQIVDNCLADADTDLLILSAGVYTLTLAGAHEDNNLTGDLDITGTLTISGVSGSPVINGNQIDRVLHILPQSNMTLNHVTIYKGRTPNGADNTSGRGENSEDGGGIANAGALTLTTSIVISNSTGDGGAGYPSGQDGGAGGNGGNGGAIFNTGVLMLINSKIANNWTGNGGQQYGIDACRQGQGSQGGLGAGVYNVNGGAVAIVASTIESNRAGQGNACPNFLSFSGGNGANGGGIANFGTMSLEASTIRGNYSGDGGDAGGVHSSGGDAGPGGGIFNGGALRIRNSTISGNRTGMGGRGGFGGSGHSGDGAGIANAGILTLTQVTISANGAGDGGFGGRGGYGGGIYSEGTARIIGSLIGGNFSTGVGADCTGLLKMYGFNLLQDPTNCAIVQSGSVIHKDPLLTPLADNGGPTWTHALKARSPALDVAIGCYNLDGATVTQDQRGVARPQGDGCDLGAYELHQ